MWLIAVFKCTYIYRLSTIAMVILAYNVFSSYSFNAYLVICLKLSYGKAKRQSVYMYHINDQQCIKNIRFQNRLLSIYIILFNLIMFYWLSNTLFVYLSNYLLRIIYIHCYFLGLTFIIRKHIFLSTHL